MFEPRPRFRPAPEPRSRSRYLGIGLALVLLAACALWAAPAFAGQASSGQLFFYPCTSCHPLGAGNTPLHPLPNNFKGHQIVLEGHSALGVGEAACLTCHDDPTRNPGMLKTANGSLVPITGDIAQVCYRCHEDKYKEWKAGTHGKHKPNCDAQGCHDPHTPQYIYAAPQLPFQGTGFQFRILPTRQPFKPLAQPAPNPGVVIPSWFYAVAAVGFVGALGLGGSLVVGRLRR
jgi:hypothetical protein